MDDASQLGGTEELKPDTVPVSDEVASSIPSDDRPPPWGRLLPINCKLSKELIRDTYTIGRTAQMCEIYVSKDDVDQDLHKLISKVHCRITRTKISTENDYVVFLEDLSSNGTFVNQRIIGKNERTIISSDDEISFATPQNKVFVFIECFKDMQYLPRDLNNKYHVCKLLGTGGFAEVVLILDKKNCRKLAVKKLTKSDIDDKKISNEVQIFQSLQHPCVVEMTDFMESEKAVFIVMEYVPNGNLLQKLQRDKFISEGLSKLIMYQLTWAVSYLHGRGISHRDLKPENILISEREEGLVVAKVADFGLSKILNSMTRLKTACGTLHYTAPEVLLSGGEREYSNKVDTWGLGVILYMCLLGCRPFRQDGGQPASLIAKILNAVYPLPPARWKSLSKAAQTLIKQLLTNNVELRLSSGKMLNNQWFNDPVLEEQMNLLFESKSPFSVQNRTEENSPPPPPKIRKVDEMSSAVSPSVV